MIVTCENCGKRHQIDTEQIRDVMTTFQCDVCNHVMTFSIQADNPGNPPTPNPEFIDLSEQKEETTPSAPETTAEESPEPGFDEPGSTSQEKPEFINLAEGAEEATPSAPEAKMEEQPEPPPPPLTSNNQEDIKWAEGIKETTPSASETTAEESPEPGFDEPGSASQEKPEFINLAEGAEETIPSTPETIAEESPEATPPPLSPGDPEDIPEDIKWGEGIKETTPSAPKTKKKALQESAPRKRREVSVRGKMFFLFLLVPICLIIAAVFIHRNSMKTLTGFIMKESFQLVTKMAENAIAEKGRVAAKEVERYLLSHPDLLKANFMQDPVLKGIGVQKVGNTGYTYLISIRTPAEASALWLHPDEKLIGKDVATVMRNILGKEYERWNRIQGVAFTQGTEAAGYYTQRGKGEHYMVMVPVEGTGFFVASTALLDEYTAPLKQLEGQVNQLTAAAARIMTIVLVAAALVIVLFFLIYNYPFSGILKKEPAAVDYTGVDDLEVETGKNKWVNESKVAPALRRMQDSIHHAINKLRERR